MLSKTVEGAQKKVEEQNFNIRKRVLEYDDVLNKQREVIYAERRRVLEGEDLGEQARDWIAETLVERDRPVRRRGLAAGRLGPGGALRRAPGLLPDELHPRRTSGPSSTTRLDPLTREELLDQLEDDAMEAYDRREERARAPTLMRDLERWVLLQLIDQHWREHLYDMDYLREGIHLRALGQKDPLSEYRLEGHAMFDEMMDDREERVRPLHVPHRGRPGPEVEEQRVAEVGLQLPERPDPGLRRRRRPTTRTARRGRQAEVEHGPRRPVAVVEQRVLSDDEKVGRNDPCPCGSGKKYKSCHGA